MTDTINVDCCTNCPFAHAVGEECVPVCAIPAQAVLPIDDPSTVPDWCPLRAAPLTVQLGLRNGD